jgi:XTP/dITP diphosphohydrolase
MTELVLATQNPGKIAELRDLLAPVGLAVLGLDDLGLGDLPEPEETGQTFEANATIKALAYARISGRLCLADDSGLEVDALGGRPGVISSHFAFDGRTDGPAAGLTRAERDAANNARLLRELEGVPAEERAARFVCVMVLANAGGGAGAGVEAVTRGSFEGRIGLPGEVPRGTGGFGYDPLFLAGPDHLRTGAELDKAEKNRLSHRGAAVRAMTDHIRRLLPNP